MIRYVTKGWWEFWPEVPPRTPPHNITIFEAEPTRATGILTKEGNMIYKTEVLDVGFVVFTGDET